MTLPDPREISRTLRRIETKLVIGLEALGVHTEADPDWLTVDDAARVIYLSTDGRSYHVMRATAIDRGAKQFGKQYELVHKGETIGTLYL